MPHRIFVFLVAPLLGVACSGCATLTVVENAKVQSSFAKIQKVRGAYRDAEKLYLELLVGSSALYHQEELLLEVPLRDSQWPRSQADDEHQTLRSAQSQLTVHHPPLAMLRRDNAPATAEPVAVIQKTVSSFREVRTILEQSEDFEVIDFVLTLPPWEATSAGLQTSRHEPIHIVAALRKMPFWNGDAPRPFLLGPLYQGETSQWGWYFLMPAAVAIDVVMLPVWIVALPLYVVFGSP